VHRAGAAFYDLRFDDPMMDRFHYAGIAHAYHFHQTLTGQQLILLQLLFDDRSQFFVKSIRCDGVQDHI